MAEATVEDAPEAETERGQSEPERPLERAVEEADVESTSADRENYEPRDGEGRYTKKVEYRKASNNSLEKPSAQSSGLERALKNAKAIGKERGIDPTEILSFDLAQRVRFLADNADKSNSDGEEKDKDRYDVKDGVTYLLFHQDPDTGQVYFSIETKTAGYRYIKERGKKALHGETARVGEFNMFNVAARGLREENPGSYKVLLNALKDNGQFYDRLKTSFDGVPAETTIIQVEIKKPEDWWGTYVPDKNVEGPKSIITLDEFFATKKSDWAFDHYDIIKGFIEKNWDRFNPQTWQYSTKK